MGVDPDVATPGSRALSCPDLAWQPGLQTPDGLGPPHSVLSSTRSDKRGSCRHEVCAAAVLGPAVGAPSEPGICE